MVCELIDGGHGAFFFHSCLLLLLFPSITSVGIFAFVIHGLGTNRSLEPIFFPVPSGFMWMVRVVIAIFPKGAVPNDFPILA